MTPARRATMLRRVCAWAAKNRAAFDAGERVALYVYDDDTLNTAGEDYQLVGVYTTYPEVLRVWDDVVEWFRLSHPAGRGRR